MECVNGAVLERSELDLTPRIGMGEMEIDAARALAGMAVKEPDPQEEDVKDEGISEAKVSEKENNQEKLEEANGSASTSQTQNIIGRRGKQNLTEAEREAKRLRRILANRESARQTIIRRRAIREELAREVAALSSENQHMKMEKEMAMQEFLSLKETNRKLKEQLGYLFPNPDHIICGIHGTPQMQSYKKKCDPNAGCSGLEIKTKLKTPSTEMSHEKIVSTVACSKESDVVKVSPNVKAAVEARDNQVIANESNE